MTWAKLSDDLYDDPDMETLSLAAIGAWTLILSYCARHETDGCLSRARALLLVRGQKKVLGELLEPNSRGEAPLVENGQGLVVRRWSKYNPTKATLEAMRASAAERQRRLKSRRESHRD
jgi:hypothetical protein